MELPLPAVRSVPQARRPVVRWDWKIVEAAANVEMTDVLCYQEGQILI